MMNPFMTRLLCVAIFLYTAGFSKTYTTNFDGTENPLSEGGVWSHVGVDWKYVQKVNGVVYGTQTGSGGYDDSYAHLSGFGPDQTAWGVIQRTSGSSGIHEVEIHLRWSDSAHSAQGYECLLSYNGSYAQIVRWNGPFGDFTYIGWAATAPVPQTGDTLKASITGNLIIVYYNGVEIMRATDSTYSTGNPGMGFYIESDGANSDMSFTSFSATDDSVTAGRGRPMDAVPSYGLLQNYPNPFNPTTTIEYNLLKSDYVRLIIFDVLGRNVKTLIGARQQPGFFQITWDGTDEQNLPVADDVYFCCMETGEFVKVIKLALVK
jgi:hypothetical protein